MKLFHKHKWKLAGVHHMFEVTLAMPKVHKPITELLEVCRCGDSRTRCLEGHWTLDQLKPEQTEKEIDREFFRKLGVKP